MAYCGIVSLLGRFGLLSADAGVVPPMRPGPHRAVVYVNRSGRFLAKGVSPGAVAMTGYRAADWPLLVNAWLFRESVVRES